MRRLVESKASSNCFSVTSVRFLLLHKVMLTDFWSQDVDIFEKSFSACHSHHSHLYKDATVDTCSPLPTRHCCCGWPQKPLTMALYGEQSQPQTLLLSSVVHLGVQNHPSAIDPGKRCSTQDTDLYHSWKSSVSFPVSEKLTVSLLCRVVLLLHNLHCAPSQRPFTFPTTLGVGLSPDAWKLVILTAKPNLFK